MRRIVIVLAVCIASSELFGQDVMSEIPFKNQARDIRTFAVGDSLLLSIQENNVNRKIYNYWIDKNWQISEAVIIAGDKSTSLVDQIMKYGKDVYTYYFTGSANHPLLAIGINNDYGLVKKLEIKGNVLGTFNNNNLYVLTFDRSIKALRVVEIIRDKIIKEWVFNLSLDLGKFHQDDVQVIFDKSYMLTSECKSKLKIYFEDSNITLVADEPYEKWFDDSNYLPKTLIYTVNLNTDKIDIRTVMEPTQNDFVSFLHKHDLYRIVNRSDRFELKIFDPLGSTKASYMLIKVEEAKKQFITQRVGDENTISRKESLFNLIRSANACKPLLCVEETKNNSVIITWGSYFNKKGTMMPIGPTNAVRLATSIIGSTSKQFLDGPGICRYFQLKEEGTNFKYSNDEPELSRSKIDSYEITQTEKGIKYNFKGYAILNSSVIGLYGNKTDGNLQLVNFGTLN